MTLTEQWDKGKLPNGWYYVRLIRGEHRIDLYINDKNEWIDCPDNIIDTVVCEVPSYEEYQRLKDMLYKCREKLDRLDYGCEVWAGELTGFIEEIDNVLGEKK